MHLLFRGNWKANRGFAEGETGKFCGLDRAEMASPGMFRFCVVGMLRFCCQHHVGRLCKPAGVCLQLPYTWGYTPSG
jgi:hypothetical protein